MKYIIKRKSDGLFISWNGLGSIRYNINPEWAELFNSREEAAEKLCLHGFFKEGIGARETMKKMAAYTIVEVKDDLLELKKEFRDIKDDIVQKFVMKCLDEHLREVKKKDGTYSDPNDPFKKKDV